MTSSLDDIFATALEKGSPEERRAYLDEACRDDPTLRRQVERLLAAHAKAGSFLESPAPEVDATLVRPAAEQPGDTIGRYKLLEEIAEGGMGVVYMAEQRAPVRRKVALKIIKPGMDTREVIARFEAERQALAMMDHPNIAKVFDASETESGRPYFVMELVDGCRLTDYCDFNELTIRRRLELFVQVCQAVHHAHQKGIIHRDIKPSNVMVALYDSMPVPKIIDFGIAKAIHTPLTERTFFTHFGQMIGTPLYMSPEQADLRDSDVDTRSDIYSLGVMLYELLTGCAPFDEERAKKAGYDEIRRMIREDEPQPPSTRVSTLKAADTAVFAHRKTDPTRLGGVLRRDLDWIVMKALEKDRTRRYDTASDYAQDIQRYLAHEPVHAGPPGNWYRLRKLAQRFRVPLAVATVFLALLTTITILSVRGYYREAKLRSDMETARDEAEIARLRAVDEAKRAKSNLKMARDAVKKYYTQVADDPRLKPHNLEKLRRDLLESANEYYEKLISQEANDPDLQHERVSALIARADIEREIGHLSAAEDACKQAFDAATRLTQINTAEAEYQDDLARCHSELGLVNEKMLRTKEAEEAEKEAIAIWRVLVAKHPEVPEYEDALAYCLHEVGFLCQGAGRDKEAEAVYKEALAIRKALADKNPAVTEYQAQLASGHAGLGYLWRKAPARANEAQANFRDAIAILKTLVKNQPDVPAFQSVLAFSHHGLGEVFQAASRFKEAEAAYKEALAIEKTLAEKHPGVPSYQSVVAGSYFQLGIVYEQAGRLKEAESAWKEALAVVTADAQSYAENQGELADIDCLLGGLYSRTGRAGEAEVVHKEAIAICKTLARKSPDQVYFQNRLADGQLALCADYRREGRVKEAETACSDALAIWKTLSEKHPGVPDYLAMLIRCHENLGALYRTTGRVKEEEAAFREALALGKTLAEKHLDVPDYQSDLADGHHDLGVLLFETGRTKEGEAAMRVAIAIRKTLVERYPEVPVYQNELADSYGNLLALYQRTGRAKELYATSEAALDVFQLNLERHPSVANNATRLALTYYYAACFHAVSLATTGRAGKDANPPTVPANASAERAFDCLQKSCNLGFFDDPKSLERMTRNRDLDALRDRPGYTKLLEKVAARAKPKQRAELQARYLQGWSQAAEDLAEVIKLTPDDAMAWHQRTMLLGKLQRKDELADHLTKMVAQFRLHPDRAPLLHSLTTFPAGTPDLIQASEFFADKLPNSQESRYWRAASHYRAGKYQEAEKLFSSAEPDSPSFGANYKTQIFLAFHAMNKFKLNDREKARELLARARKGLKKEILDDHGAEQGDYGEHWWDRLSAEALLAEAENLIASPKP